MFPQKRILLILAGFLAGCINGLFGAGGGMVLVPMLTFCALLEEEIFPASVCIILPICIVSLYFISINTGIPWKQAAPYLLGSAAGGIFAGIWGKKIPVNWLHRALGIMILWGGFRYLC